MHVLLIEPHTVLARALKQGLEEEGFVVAVAHDPKEADAKAAAADYDIIILDAGLSKGGAPWRWRGNGVRPRVLALTPDDCAADGAEADDYLAKPFALEELLARLRALDGPASGACQRPGG